MKKPNKHAVRLVAAATTAGMMLPACVPYIDTLIVQSEDLPARGTHAIELDLTRAELDYLRFLQRLSDDIVRNPEIAQAFARNPQLFLEQYGFHEPIDLDEGMLRLTLALGDTDINAAVNAGDISLVLSLMEEKGILTDIANSFVNLDISEEQAREILLAMGIVYDRHYLAHEADFFAAAVAVVLIGAVVVTAAAVIQVVYFIAGAWTHAHAWTVHDVAGASTSDSKLIDSNLPLKIWSLKGKPNDTYIAVDMYLENQVNKIIDLVKSHNISFDEDKMRNFLKLNIVMQNN